MILRDRDFVYNYGAEILFETAKYMAHRGCFVDGYGGRFCINAVCGPDEYACGVNNNCYTNLMVRFHLNYALRIYNEMLENDKAKLDEVIAKTGIDKEELALWKKASDNMYYRVNKELGIYEQDDCFVYNDPVDMDTLPRHSDIRTMFHPLDLWRMQVLKQADVVLLTFVLGDLFMIITNQRQIMVLLFQPLFTRLLRMKSDIMTKLMSISETLRLWIYTT